MEPIESNREIENERSLCFELAGAAFSSNEIDLERYESIAAEIAGAEGLTALQTIRAGLPAIPEPPPVVAQIVQAQGSKITRSGKWLESSEVRLSSRGSRVILDFTAYRLERDLRVNIEVECRGSTIRILVPDTIDVIDRIDSNKASVFRDKHRPIDANSAITITGSITGSSVKIKRKKRR